MGLPGCFSINEIYSYFITYLLSISPGIRFSGPKENTSFWAKHSDVYVICFFNNLCDTHLQSFNSMKLLMGAPAIAVKQLLPSFAFPSSKILQTLSQRNTCPGVSVITPAGRQLPFGPDDVENQMIHLNPYPSHYKMAFAFSCILLPHLHQCALRFHLPNVPGKDTGFPRSTLLPISG